MLIDATESPSHGVDLDPIIWAVIGFAVGVIVTVILCLLLFTCCYFTCFSSRIEKRKKHDIQGKSITFFTMASAIQSLRLCVLYYVGTESLTVKSSSKQDPIELTSATTVKQ